MIAANRVPIGLLRGVGEVLLNKEILYAGTVYIVLGLFELYNTKIGGSVCGYLSYIT